MNLNKSSASKVKFICGVRGHFWAQRPYTDEELNPWERFFRNHSWAVYILHALRLISKSPYDKGLISQCVRCCQVNNQ